MKKRNVQNSLMPFMLGIVLALLGGCDSGLGGFSGAVGIGDTSGGMGEIRIGPGGQGQSLTALPTTELDTMTYDVWLTGPSGPIDPQSFGPAGGSILLASGSWDITAKAYIMDGNTRRLRGIAEDTITVSPGKTHTVKMKSCIGVTTAAELKDIFTPSPNTTDDTLYNRYPPDTTSGAGDLIVLENKSISINEGNITATVAATGIISIGEVTTGVPRHVTIIAEPGTTQTLTSAAFTVEDGASLTLGKTEYTGKLVFDGGGIDYGDLNGGYGAFALHITGGSSLTINGNTEITNCKNRNGKGGAITLAYDSSLTINGGEIYANENTESTTDKSFGGAIYVDGSTFVMNGGTIRNNSAKNKGGGVYIATITNPYTASFTMNGGTIKDNSADVEGGGVYVEEIGGRKATFTMETGSTISGNTAGGFGGGVWNNGEFIMLGGTISNNTVTTDFRNGIAGGGIYINSDSSSIFTMMTGSTVTGNKVISTESSGGSADGGGIWGVNLSINGGTISNNEASSDTGPASGGGIFVTTVGTSGGFGLSGGASISGNTASTNGGGVYVEAGGPSVLCDFNMFAGAPTISGNTATLGGGVYIVDAHFTMDAGTISGNTALDSGGGVYATSSSSAATFSASFTLSSGASISGNYASTNGGGVYTGLASGGYGLDFTMSGGTISGNTVYGASGSWASGGGLYLGSAVVANMTGGAIDGNTVQGGGSRSVGGGIYVYTGDFILKNVTVSGNTVEHASIAQGGGLYTYRPGSTAHEMGDGTKIINNTAKADLPDGIAEGGGIYDNNNSGPMPTVSAPLTITGNEVIGGTGTTGGGINYSVVGGLLDIHNNSTFSENKVNGVTGSGLGFDYIGDSVFIFTIVP
ncbi:hypothetical protein AGMMS49928_10530 [Spirochaetia bacterium]|nr:hypothetical protein AGMMS49928_10530 [Spirochaetia bacterium]